MDTIFALATARGRAGVAVVRISGPRAVAAAEALAGPLAAPRRAALRRLHWQGDLLDEALVLRFAAGASFTGEDVVELQLHGSPAAVSAVLSALSAQDGLRPAEAGEFTRRALENGRMDLAEVEGLSDLLAAETEAQRRQAMRVFSGGLGEKTEGWRQRLIRAVALLEATIDFADEDVPVDVTPEVRELIGSVLTDLRREEAGAGAAERLRDGFEVAILGRPNTGKSTLLNSLAGREAAITSEFAGTTRDVIEVRMDLQGLPVTILDTAGLRETGDVVERIGIERARDRALAADLRVFLLDHEGLPDGIIPQDQDIILRGKSDLGRGEISGRTGAGVDDLIFRIVGILSARVDPAVTITRERHRVAIHRTITALEQVIAGLNDSLSVDIAAEILYSAIRALNSLVGRVDVEDVLDEIFSSFCIGK